MVKKAMALLVVSCMMLGSVNAMAAESAAESAAATAEAVEISWETITAQEGAEEMVAAGEFVTFDEIACQMWMPNVMLPVELTEEDKEAGYIGYYSTADQEASAAVMYVDVEGMDLESYKAYLAEDPEVSEITDVTVNGITALGYDLKEKDTTCISFATAAGYILEFSFAPASDEGYSAVIACMMASIQEEATDSAAAATEEAASGSVAAEAESAA